MTAYVRLWLDLLRLSWRQERGLTCGVFGIEAGLVVANLTIALSLRFAVDGMVAHRLGPAVAAAVAAAAGCAAVLVLSRLHGLIGLFLLVEKVGLVIDAEMAREMAAIEGIEHLERAEYLDRVAVLRGGARRLVGGAWTAVRSVFTVLQLAGTLLLLGDTGPWLLALAVFAVAPLAADRAGRRVEERTETATGDAFRLQQHLFELATDAGAGKEIRVAGVGAAVAHRQAVAWESATAARFAARVRAAALRSVGWAAFVAGFVLALGLLVHRVDTGAATAGQVVMVVTLTISLQQTVQTMVGQLTTTMSAGIYIEPYLWLRSYAATDREARTGTAPAPQTLREGIALTGIGYTYPGAASPALQDIHVFLPAGAVVALVGEHGSGKTTLVKLLSKLYRPGTGSITVDGTDLAAVDTAAWRARTSAVYQDFGRYPQTTFAEAVGLGEVSAIGDTTRIVGAVAAADAEALVARLHDGLETRLGRQYGGTELSEGQWQKTALARAWLRADPLLCTLDEPTASLDAPSEHAIFEQYMAQARRQATRDGAVTVVVSHRLSTVSGADLVLVLERGRLVEQGTHEALLRAGGRYAEMYTMQAIAYRMAAEDVMATAAALVTEVQSP